MKANILALCFVWCLVSPQLTHGKSIETLLRHHDKRATSINNYSKLTTKIDSSECIDTEAWEHAVNLAQHTMADIGLYSVETKATSKTIPDSAVLSSGPIGTQYIIHAKPSRRLNKVDVPLYKIPKAASYIRNCFDPQNVQYEEKLSQVTELSEEYITGCTPFRKIAMVLNKYHMVLGENIRDMLKSHIGAKLDGDIFEELDKYMAGISISAFESDDEDQIFQILAEGLDKNILRPIYGADGTISNKSMIKLAQEIIKQSLSKELLESDEDSVSNNNNPSDLRNSFYCMPALAGSIGSYSGNGLDIHENSWNRPLFLNGFVTKCDIPPMCARLATAELLNFSQAHAGIGFSLLKQPSYENCLTTKETSDTFFAHCWEKAVRNVCVKNRVCCTSTDVHEACKQSTRSLECRQMCKKFDS